MKKHLYAFLAATFVMAVASCEKKAPPPDKPEVPQESRSKALKALDGVHDEAMKRDTQLEPSGPAKNMPQSIPTKRN